MLELQRRIEEDISKVLEMGLSLTFPKWRNLTPGVWSKLGSFFIVKERKGEEVNIIACHPMGAVMIVNHMSPFEEGQNIRCCKFVLDNVAWFVDPGKLLNCISSVSQIMNISENWIFGFISGWDAIDYDGKSAGMKFNEVTKDWDFCSPKDAYLRSIYDADAYDLGLKLREQYNL